jgi:hypothetical protein
VGRPPRQALDRVESKTGIEPFGRLVDQFMSSEPYKSAARLLDRRQRRLARRQDLDRAHAGQPPARPADRPADPRLLAQPDRAVPLDRAAQSATPNDFASLHALADRLLAFGDYYRQIARPFEWTFTLQDLDRVLARTADREPHLQLAA